MNAAKIDTTLNTLLGCSMCLQIYQDPRILPCGHTFCLSCLQHIKHPVCYQCKQKWAIPAKGFQDLPKNFIVENFISSFPSVTKCSLAGNENHGPTKYFCINCWDPLCEICAKGHTKFAKMAKGHVIKNFNDVNESDIENHNRQNAMYCAKHKNQELMLYCLSCKEFNCTVCFALSHNKHECISVEEADGRITNEINEAIKQMQKNIEKYNDQIKSLLTYKNEVTDKKKNLLQSVNSLLIAVKAKIQSEYEQFLKRTNESFENTVERINESANKEVKNIEDKVADVNTILQSLKEAVSSLERHLAPSSSAIEKGMQLKQLSADREMKKDSNIFSVKLLGPPAIEKWTLEVYKWVQSYVQKLSSVERIPLWNDENDSIVNKTTNGLVYFAINYIRYKHNYFNYVIITHYTNTIFFYTCIHYFCFT